MKKHNLTRLLPALTATLAGTSPAHAQLTTNRYWDPSGSGNFGSINNTTVWVSPLNTMWGSQNGGSARLQNYTTTLNDICNWGGPMPPASPTNPLGGGIVPVGIVNAGWLSFNYITARGVTLSGGTITLNTNARIIVNDTTFTHTITSTLAGAATGMTKTGPGTVVLSGSNIFTGPTAVSAGTLALGSSKALANSPLNTADSIAGDAANGLQTTVASLTFGGLTGDKDLASLFRTTSGGFETVRDLTLNPAAAVVNTYSGAIGDGAAGMHLLKEGLGTQILAGANTYTGDTYINAGTLTLDYSSEDNRKLSATGALVLGNGTLELTGGTHEEAVASTTLAGNAKVTRSSGAARISLGAISGTGTVDFSGDNIATTTTPNNSLGLLPFATIGGSDLATNDGSGNIVTFSGYTDIDARGPSTVPDNASAIVRILGDGTSGDIVLATPTNTIYSLLQSNASFAATIDTADKSLATTAITVGASAESLQLGVAAGDGILRSPEDGGNLSLTSANAAKSLTLNASIVNNTSASAVSTAGGGTVVLAGTNTYTGATTVGGGSLVLSGSLAGSAVSVVGDAVIIQTSSGSIAGDIGITHDSIGTSTLAGANSYTGATAINTGIINIQNANALGDTAAGTSVASGAALQLQNDITVGAEALTLQGSGIAGSGALVNISGTNTYGGPVTLTGDTLITSVAGKLTLSHPGSLVGTATNLTVEGAGSTTIDSTIETTSGSIAKRGTGTLMLTGANTFTGGVNVTGGVLNIRNDTALGTAAGGVVVGNGAALELQGDITVGAEALTLVGTGVSGTGALRNISGDNTWGGAITLSTTTRFQSDAGTLTLDVPSGNAIVGTGPAAGAGANPPMVFGGDGNITVADPIVSGWPGTGTLTKQGTGTLTFQAANNYTGPTVISAGIVSLENALGMQSSPLDTAASVAGDATNGLKTSSPTLVLGGLIGDKNLADMFTTSSGGYDGVTALTLNPGLDRSYSGTIADGAAGMTLTKSGAAVQTVSGALTHTGATTISGGTLKLGAEASIAATPSITLGAGGSLDVSTLSTPLSLVEGQTLRASATGANASGSLITAAANDLTLSAGGLVFTGYGGANGTNSANAPLIVTGTSAGELKLNGAPVTVTTTTSLAPGNYVLVAAGGSALVSGTPGALIVNGVGVDGIASLSVSQGQLVLGVVTGGYEGWTNDFPGLTNIDSTIDFDGDGLSTGIEFVVGGNPTVNDAGSVAPTLAQSDTGLVFTYRRADLANTDPAATIRVSYSTDLQSWTPAEEGVDGVSILVTDDFYAAAPAGIDKVEVTLPSALAAGGRLFARLEVSGLPAILFSADFEEDNGGFIVTTEQGTPWAWGDPDSTGPGGSVTTGNGGSANCWGTGIGNPGYFIDPTTTALRSPVIDLTGVTSATLFFAQALDLEAGDTAVVNIIDDDSDTVIAPAVYTATDGSGTTAIWAGANGGMAIPIPVGALGQKVRIEWKLRGFGGSSDDYMGWYIDDVVVRTP